MSYNEEQLYYECMNFCKAFFHFMCKKNELESFDGMKRYDEHDRRQIMDFERTRLNNSFVRLKESIKKVELKE